MTAPTDTRATRPHFVSWRDVPTGIYATATQLKTMDLPRQPGPPAATVDGLDGIGRNTTITLYWVDQSVPTASTAAQLAAIRARSENSVRLRVCADCGARPDRAPIATDSYGALCPTCWHIRGLRRRQEEAAVDRAAAVQTARDLLRPSSRSLGVLHVDYTERGHTPSGIRRSPAAARVTVLGANGEVLADPLLRLVSARAKGIPDGSLDGAGDPGPGAEMLAATLSTLTVLVWQRRDLEGLAAGLHLQGAAWILPSHEHVHEMAWLTTAWRCEVTPDGERPMPVAPGRADRMLYLLRQIADTEQAPAMPIGAAS
ncbi:hypothetical protein [Streptomyces cavernae]|uniref:hypothetical protein n=1 Tax=Streptomyces cavernae TaxID=2259034 RepID=UPI000FEBF901|nr:hypothetical protein [Streptomyces cavernae]